MAPSHGTTSTLPPHHSTLQWHPATAPRPLPQSWPSPSSPHHSTLQWQWHPAMAPRPLPQSWSSPPNHSTLQWHPAMAPRPLHPAMAPWCHVQSAKVVRRPPPYWKKLTGLGHVPRSLGQRRWPLKGYGGTVEGTPQRLLFFVVDRLVWICIGNVFDDIIVTYNGHTEKYTV